MLLKKISFIISVMGIGVLLGFLLLPAKEITAEDLSNELNKFEINEKISFTGRVDSERVIEQDFRILKLENFDFDIVCECEESYLDKEVKIEGRVEEYNGEKQIRVFRIAEK